MINYTAFGNAIRYKREQERLSLSQLGERLGISKGYLSTIETGQVVGMESRLVL